MLVPCIMAGAGILTEVDADSCCLRTLVDSGLDADGILICCPARGAITILIRRTSSYHHRRLSCGNWEADHKPHHHAGGLPYYSLVDHGENEGRWEADHFAHGITIVRREADHSSSSIDALSDAPIFCQSSSSKNEEWGASTKCELVALICRQL